MNKNLTVLPLAIMAMSCALFAMAAEAGDSLDTRVTMVIVSQGSI